MAESILCVLISAYWPSLFQKLRLFSKCSLTLYHLYNKCLTEVILALIFQVSYSNSVIYQKLKFYYSILVRVRKLCMVGCLKRFSPNGCCHKQNNQRFFIWILWPLYRILHCIIYFMFCSECIAPILITALISQCVTKVFAIIITPHVVILSQILQA